MNVKRGTTPTLRICLKTVDMSLVKRIDFVFKEQKKEQSKVLITKSYPENGGIYNMEKDFIELSFTDSETRLFPSECKIYMDTRIVLNDGSIPETSISEFYINPTLFAEGTK